MKKVLDLIKNNVLETVIICLVVISIFVMFVPYGHYYYQIRDAIDYEANGFNVIFGLKDGKYQIYDSSAIGIILFVLLLLSIVLPCLKKYVKYETTFELLLAIITTVFFYLLPTSVNHVNETVSKYYVVNNLAYLAPSIYAIIVVILLVVILKQCFKSLFDKIVEKEKSKQQEKNTKKKKSKLF